MKEIVNKLHENRQIELAKEIMESNGYKVAKKSKRLKEASDPDYELQNMISESLANAIYDIFKSNRLDPEDDSLMQDFYYAVDIDNVVYDTAKFIESHRGVKGV